MENYRTLINPILIIDDEYSDVERLLNLLDSAQFRLRKSKKYRLLGKFYDYVGNSEEAMETMIRKLQENETYSAIICDNHMKGDMGESIDGDDFLRIIKGEAGYCLSKFSENLNKKLWDYHSFNEFYDSISGNCDEEVQDFLEYFFNEKIGFYQGFVEHYFGENVQNPKVMMMCGNPDGVIDEGLEEIVKIQKIDECELNVISELSEVIPHSILYRSYKEDPVLSPYNHENHRKHKPKKRKRFDPRI